MRIEIDIEDSYGVKQGPGPIITAVNWQHTRRLDRAGSFSFMMPASDSRRQYVQAKRIARCWGWLNGERQELGAGIIDAVEYVSGQPPMLRVSGDDLLRELTYRTVGDLELITTTRKHVVWAVNGGALSPPLYMPEVYDLGLDDTTTETSFRLGIDAPWHWYLDLWMAHPFDSLTFVLGSTVNTVQPCGLGMMYWDSEGDEPGWQVLTVTADGTNSGTEDNPKTMSQSGTITFERPAGWGRASGESTYKLRLHSTTADTTPVDVSDISASYKTYTKTALADVMALAPPGWTLDGTQGYTTTFDEEVAGNELLSNNGFETYAGTPDDGTSDTFTNWTSLYVSDGDGNKVEATAGAHGGSAAVMLSQGGALPNENPLIYQDVSVEDLTDYRISFWTKGDGTHQGAYRIQDNTTGSWLTSPIDTGITGTTWTYYTELFVVPENTTSIRVLLYAPWYIYAGSVAYFDDISIKRAVHSGELYLEMADESVLESLVRVAEQTGQHFILSYSGRRVLWLGNDQRDLAIVVVSAEDPAAAVNDDIAVIESIQEVQNSYEVCSRVYPRGGGYGSNRVTLANTTRSALAGYTLDKVNGYLLRDASESGLPRIDKPLSFPDINAESATERQLQLAANALFDRAYEYLRYHSFTDGDPVTGDVPRLYSLRLTKCQRAIWPGHRLTIEYNRWSDGYKFVAIDTALWVLASTIYIDQAGVQTVAIQASTVPIQPDSDVWAMASEVRTARAFRAHAQVEQGLTSEGGGVPGLMGIRDGKLISVNKLIPSGTGDVGTFVINQGKPTGVKVVSGASGDFGRVIVEQGIVVSGT